MLEEMGGALADAFILIEQGVYPSRRQELRLFAREYQSDWPGPTLVYNGDDLTSK